MLGVKQVSHQHWHNPYPVKQYQEQAIPLFEQYIRSSLLMNEIEELRGKRLGCWCSPKPCHGDVLVKILNERPRLILNVVK